MNFVGGATSLDFSPNLTKLTWQKSFSPMNGSIVKVTWTSTNFFRTKFFLSNLSSSNPIEKEHICFGNLPKRGFSKEQTVAGSQVKNEQLTSDGNRELRVFALCLGKRAQAFFCKVFEGHNNKYVVPPLPARQEWTDLYNNKCIDMLKLGFTSPISAKIFRHKSIGSNCYHFTKSDTDWFEKIREEMVGARWMVFTRKAVVDETLMRKSTNLRNSFVGIDDSQLQPFSMCRPMPTILYTILEYDKETKRFTPHQNKNSTFEKMVLSYFETAQSDCRIESNDFICAKTFRIFLRFSKIM